MNLIKTCEDICKKCKHMCLFDYLGLTYPYQSISNCSCSAYAPQKCCPKGIDIGCSGHPDCP